MSEFVCIEKQCPICDGAGVVEVTRTCDDCRSCHHDSEAARGKSVCHNPDSPLYGRIVKMAVACGKYEEG